MKLTKRFKEDLVKLFKYTYLVLFWICVWFSTTKFLTETLHVYPSSGMTIIHMLVLLGIILSFFLVIAILIMFILDIIEAVVKFKKYVFEKE